MTYAGRLILTLVLVATSVSGLPNHLKAVVIDDPVAPRQTSVGASWGPYSASAGLGGSSEGGGLFASANSPFGNAGAGLAGGTSGGGGGASASSGASAGAEAGGAGVTGITAGSHPHRPSKPGTHPPGPGFFDGVFNIPISVLQAVNTYLNNRGPIMKPVGPPRRRVHQPEVVYKITPEQTNPEGADSEGAVSDAADKSASAGASSGAVGASASSSGSVGASAGATPGAHHGHGPVVLTKRVNYDDIFNIPISALKSVNQLLNGKK